MIVIPNLSRWLLVWLVVFIARMASGQATESTRTSIVNDFAFVLYVNVPLTEEGKKSAQTWTRELVDAVIANRGTFYLLYQLYPSGDQVRVAYPMLDQFFLKKREYDSNEICDSAFYENYRVPAK